MGGISLMDVVDEVVAVLAADAALLAWSKTHYGSDPALFVGLDERDRPGPEACPLVLIRPDRQTESDGYYVFSVQIDWAVHDDTATVSGTVREYAAVRRVDEMGRLILAALEAGLPDVLGMTRTDYQLETVERFPLVLGGVDLNFNVPVMMSGQLTLGG